MKDFQEVIGIGLMSGTSCDGSDGVVIKLTLEAGEIVQVKIVGSDTISYPPEFRILLKSAEYAVRSCQGNLEAAKTFFPEALKQYLTKELKLKEFVAFEKLKSLSLYIHNDENIPVEFDQVIEKFVRINAELVNNLKKNYSETNIDFVGFHGQTLFHKPCERITIQVGDGQLLAVLTGLPVINQFRLNDVKQGGQGAPFAPLFHHLLASLHNRIPCAIVNCGGIANVTYINEDLSKLLGFDTGPGNNLIDRLIQQRTSNKEFMDEDGKYAKAGQINFEVLASLFEKGVKRGNSENFLAVLPPKSLDISNLILIPELNQLSIEDACATLAYFTALTIVNSLDFMEPNDWPKTWILAGGGWNNPAIKENLEKLLKEKVGLEAVVLTALEATGIKLNEMEGGIFAYLALLSLQGLPISLPQTTGVPFKCLGGHCHLPPNNEEISSFVKEAVKENLEILTGYANDPEYKKEELICNI